MKAIFRQLFTLILSTAVGFAPLAYADSSARKLTARAVIDSDSPENMRAATQARFGASSSELSGKVNKVLKASGHVVGSTILNDVIQASLIMAASAVAQLTRDRLERNRLLAGHQPKFEEVKTEAFQAAQDILCGADPKKASITSEIACSGEFWMGFAGGAVARVGIEVTVGQALKALLRTNPTRAAIIQTVGTFATSFLMISGFTMAGHLWTQAVHVMNDSSKEERAHNLFGRAVAAYVGGNWETYRETEDGKLASEIFTNMNNILLFDSELRQGWVYNAWRFGLARGELVVNLAILMTALSAGSALGASGAAALGLSGFTAGAFAFIIASAVGAGVSAAIIYLPDAEVGVKITSLIQDTRAWFANFNHSSIMYSLENSANGFDVNRFNTPITAKYRVRYENRVRLLLPELRNQRVNGINVAFEKYFELRGKLEQAEATLAMAQEVISNSNLRDKMVVQSGAEIMSYQQAKENFCQGRSRCAIPLSYQLKKIDEAKIILKDGRLLLEQIANQIISVYDGDAQFLQGLLDKTELQFPADIAITMKNEADNLGIIAEKLGWYMGALHSNIARARGLTFDSETDLRVMKALAKDAVSQNYVQGLNEDKILGKLKVTSAQN